ncbi:MAG: hypothetical protein IKK76_03060 [Alphaproteobacteria bacterium]|nr:hypothetical protein [Alphaproteobacteria bacterium]
MNKFGISLLCLMTFMADSVAAPAVRRGRGAATNDTATETTTTTTTTAARAAVRGASRTSGGGDATTTVAARSASRAPVAARAATASTVVARAGAKQNVISTGTKVAAATQNTAVSAECRQKFEGCMDSFCMLDNETGGRCICSNKNAEFDDILAEIEKLDQQSYQMATLGLERLQMGADADAAIANANAAADAVLRGGQNTDARSALDLSMWDTPIDIEEVEESIFGGSESAIAGKEGDALYNEATNICATQVPECASDMNMLKLMYLQRIKSDCAAYENSLKARRNDSQKKLTAAEQALREEALTQLRSANRYDLGECTIEFKSCMQTTAGCGKDFAQCASIAAMDATNSSTKSSKSPKKFAIQGAATVIEIQATTYDTLMGKKPLCETVLKSCTLVADKVWDTFLKEVAPQLKSAELIAEDNVRQNCIGNIASCFQKACKDNMDPNDPDGSYDVCLSRPETMLDFCKVPLNACGIVATVEGAEENQIWGFVKDRLASIRVDSCTKSIKECLTAEDRCGADYSQCIGLDTDTIVRMCPEEKLFGCEVQSAEKTGGVDVYERIESYITGIMLNMDNNFLKQCQKAADEAMIRVCGDTENCNALTIDDGIGSRSLEYKLCKVNEAGEPIDSKCAQTVDQILDNELGYGCEEKSAEGDCIKWNDRINYAGHVVGVIPWDMVEFFDENGDLKPDSAIYDRYDDLTEEEQAEIKLLYRNVKMAIDTIESDTRVDFCMNGRQVQGLRKSTDDGDFISMFGKENQRFDALTKQMRQKIATAALKKAKDNYAKKMDEFAERKAQDYVALGQRIAAAEQKNAYDARREDARIACVNMAKSATLGTSYGKRNLKSVAYDTNVAPDTLIGSHSRNDWNYKEVTTTTFDMETLMCTKCVRVQTCTKPKRKWCKTWGEEKETCTNIQL